MLSIKPELHNIEQPQRRFEPQSTCAENFVKFFCDELTDIQTDMLITIPRIPAEGEIIAFITSQRCVLLCVKSSYLPYTSTKNGVVGYRERRRK